MRHCPHRPAPDGPAERRAQDVMYEAWGLGVGVVVVVTFLVVLVADTVKCSRAARRESSQ